MDISGGSKVGNESRGTITEFSKSKSIQRGSKVTDNSGDELESAVGDSII